MKGFTKMVGDACLSLLDNPPDHRRPESSTSFMTVQWQFTSIPVAQHFLFPHGL